MDTTTTSTTGHVLQYDSPPPPTFKRKKTVRQRLGYRLQTGQHHFNKWLDNTSIHGIVHVFKGKSRFRRLLWFLIFLGASLGCIAILGYDIYIWAGDPSTTTISFTSNSEGQTFPAVTLCNLNPMRQFSAPPATIQLLSQFANPTSLFIQNWNITSQINVSSCSNSINLLTAEEKRDTLLKAYTSSGHQLDEFVVYCGFAGNDGTIVNCKDTLKPVLTSMGICYTFNSAYAEGAREYKVNRPGPMYGLNIILNINRSQYTPLSQSSIGAKVSVHARDTLPIPHETGLTLTPSTNSYLAIEKIDHVDETRESACIRRDRSLLFFPSHSYSVSTCRINALYQDFAQPSKCSCSPAVERPNSGPYSNTRNCTIADICCLMEEYTTYNPSLECPPACKYISYNVQPSYSDFLSPQLAQDIAIKHNMTVQDVSENLLSLYVYFDEMQVTQLHTVYTYTFANLLADMGGLLGLFIGASVISLLEVAMLVFDFLKSLLLNPKLKKVVKELENKITLPEVELKGPIGEEEEEEHIPVEIAI